MGKFKIHPFRQEKAILNENGQILRKWPYIETRPFHQKPSFHQKWLCYYFSSFQEFPWLLIPFAVCFLCIGMCIQSTHTCLNICMPCESPLIHSCQQYKFSMQLLCSGKCQITIKFLSQFPALNFEHSKEKWSPNYQAWYPMNCPRMQTSLNSIVGCAAAVGHACEGGNCNEVGGDPILGWGHLFCHGSIWAWKWYLLWCWIGREMRDNGCCCCPCSCQPLTCWCCWYHLLEET